MKNTKKSRAATERAREKLDQVEQKFDGKKKIRTGVKAGGWAWGRGPRPQPLYGVVV